MNYSKQIQIVIIIQFGIIQKLNRVHGSNLIFDWIVFLPYTIIIIIIMYSDFEKIKIAKSS